MESFIDVCTTHRLWGQSNKPSHPFLPVTDSYACTRMPMEILMIAVTLRAISCLLPGGKMDACTKPPGRHGRKSANRKNLSPIGPISFACQSIAGATSPVASAATSITKLQKARSLEDQKITPKIFHSTHGPCLSINAQPCFNGAILHSLEGSPLSTMPCLSLLPKSFQ